MTNNGNNQRDGNDGEHPLERRSGRQLRRVERSTGVLDPSVSAGGMQNLAPPPALSSGPDAMSLVKALRRRWLLAGGVGVLLAASTLVAIWFIVPAKYQAFSLLQVSANRVQLAAVGEGRNDLPTYMKTQAGRIKSREVLMKALNQDQVRGLRIIKRQPDTLTTLAWLEENLKIDQDGSELLTVTLTGEEPAELVVLVNALTRSYLNIIGSQEQALRKDRVDKMKMLYEAAKEKLSEKVAARDALAKGQGGAKDAVAMTQKQATLMNQLTRALEQAQQVQFELEKKQIQLASQQAARKKLDSQPPPEISNSEFLNADLVLKQDQIDLGKLTKAVDRMIFEGHKETDGTLVHTKRKLENVKKRIEDRTKELRDDYTARYRKKQDADAQATIAALQVEIAPLENQAKRLSEKVETLTKETELINISTQRNQVLESEIAQLDTTLLGHHKQLKNFEADEQSESRINPVGEAEWQNRDSKKRIFLLILGPVAALIIGIMGVAWCEFMARRIHGPDEVVNGLAMRVVGAVPALPDPRRSSDPEEEEIYRHNLIESIDAIRTMLLRNADSEGLRVVMVTSAVGGEGKTTLASNLAMSLARAGRRTLLMDCDLRRPAAHQLLEQTLQPGFSEVVLSEVELPDAVRPTTTDPNLFLLPAGHWDREVIQGLCSGIENIFEKLKAEFDFVIVDSHPVLPATDSLLIGQHVDAVIVSLMRDVSQVHHVYSACQQLATLGIRVFGAVVNGVPVKVYGKGYSYAAQPQTNGEPVKVEA